MQMMIRKTNINLLVSVCVSENCKTIVKTIAASLQLKFYCDQSFYNYGQQNLKS